MNRPIDLQEKDRDGEKYENEAQAVHLRLGFFRPPGTVVPDGLLFYP